MTGQISPLWYGEIKTLPSEAAMPMQITQDGDILAMSAVRMN